MPTVQCSSLEAGAKPTGVRRTGASNSTAPYAGPLYIGIDWSGKKHDVSFVNQAGAVIQQMVVEHSVVGFCRFETARQALGVERDHCIIGIETSYNLLVDYLWSVGYAHLYIMPPGIIDANRKRNRVGNAKDDRFDAFVIADTLRTDQHKFLPFGPGSALLQRMRILVNRQLRYTQETTRLSNQLANLLYRYYPAARATFKSWPTKIACHLVCAYPTPAAAQALSWEQFQAFAAQHGYTKRQELLGCFDRLQAAYPATPAELTDLCPDEAVLYAQRLLQAMQVKEQNRKQLTALFAQHPDQALFASLPGAGEWLAPALLVKFGEDRQRFPTANHVQALAGTCPETRQSGNKRTAHFRHSCDHDFRFIAHEWALAAVNTSPWAASYYAELRQRLPENDALRRTANRLLAILWKLWHSGQTYDETYHLHNRSRRRKPRP